MPYFNSSTLVTENKLESVMTKDKKDIIEDILREECSLLEELSVDYNIVQKGSLSYHSGEKVICLPLNKITHHIYNYQEIVPERILSQLGDFETYSRNIIQLIISHEAGHAMSMTIEKVNSLLENTINDLMDYLIVLDYDGIYKSEKDLHDLKYAEEESAWNLGKTVYKGNTDLYNHIMEYELQVYRDFIKERFIKLAKDIERYKANHK